MADDMTDEERKAAMMRAAGQCNFTCLSIFTCIAFILGLYSTAYCAFVSRNVILNDSIDNICSQLPSSDQSTCQVILQDHGVGFWGWQGTIPVNQRVCFSYTLSIPDTGYVTLYGDTKFNTAKASAFVANVFGGLAFFTLAFASCCPIRPGTLKGLSCNYFIATLFQGLTFLIIPSNVCQKGFYDPYFVNSNYVDGNPVESVSCGLSTGSKMAIASTVFYFWAMCTVPSAQVPPTMLPRQNIEAAPAEVDA